MPHILLITSSFPDDYSGTEAAGSFVADLVDELANKVRVTVLTPGEKTGTENHGSKIINRFPVPIQPLSLLDVRNPSHWFAIYQTLHSGKLAIRRLTASDRYDYILALWVLPSGYWARCVAKSGLPYAVWALGSDIWSLGRIPLVSHFLKKTLREADDRFADGYQLQLDVEKLSGKPCRFLPSTRRLEMPHEKVRTPHLPYRLAYLGRWHRNKGIDLLIDALTLLKPEDWDRIEAIRICGGGPLEDEVIRRIENLKKAGWPVTRQGYLDKAGARALLEWTDYLCIPSRIESIPVVFSDAMQAGVPVIAMPTGDLPGLLSDHEAGILAGEISAPAYCSALRKALQTDTSVFTPAIRAASRRFDLTQIADTLLESVSSTCN